MRILIISGNAYSANDSCANIARVISSFLAEKGHEIAFLTTDCDKSIKEIEDVNGSKYFFISGSFERNIARMGMTEKWDSLSRKSKLLYLLRHPRLLICRLIYSVNSKYEDYQYLLKKAIEKLCKRHQYDVTMSFSEPFVCSFALSEADVSCIKVMFQVDPYASGVFRKSNYDVEIKKEIQMIENLDLIMVTPQIYKENHVTILNKYLDKMISIDYPNVRKIKYNHNFPWIKPVENKINCYYIGSFYDEIRQPDFLINLFSMQEFKDVVLHVIGDCCGEKVKKILKKCPSNIILHGLQPLEVALNTMLRAEILVSVNNTVKNQVPGKLYDYISTGRPILNICKMKDCQTIEILEQYPMKYNVFETEKVTEKQIHEIKEFLIGYRNKTLSYSEVENLYRENTVGHVGNQIVGILNKMLIHKNKK